ncbi:MAG TPA: M28 family peptidase [Verrucomicrobiae bacterium]|nr:M28 family peptidase [Verrucomicrobiae bacterium]
MRRTIAALAAGLLLASGAGSARADDWPDTTGSRTAAVATDRQTERFLIDVPTAQGALDDSARLNEEAHYAGSIGDHDMALWMRDKLASYGFSAHIEPVFTQVPQLKRAVLQLLSSPRVDFDLKERWMDADPDAGRPDAGLPFTGWSGNGDVTAPLVYANQGLDADYATLAAAHVDVRGRILLIRYGAEFRGALARRAQARGAAGVLFYSEPMDRNETAPGAPYPDGPYRPMGSVQRGSVGKPEMDIPVLPISAANAQRLLQSIAGTRSPDAWHGALDADYDLGVSGSPVRMRVDESYPWMTIWNTIATLPGLDTSHEVILGGHRDAWVYGVTDNGSGISTLLEAARALGYIYRSGWRPQYSIVVAGWDGEEIGEVGSDSYVRSHQAELRHGCIAYVNADENATGSFFYASAVAGLANLVPHIARVVPDPRIKADTVWQTWASQQGGVQTQAPGGGSDHEPFLYLLGIPTLTFAYVGPFGTYHSAFDDLRYAITQADPGFNDHKTLAQLLALTAFRLTLGPVPYRLQAYAEQMRATLAKIASATGDAAEFAPLGAAIDRFAKQSALADAQGVDLNASMEAVRRLDLLIYGSEGYASVAFPKIADALATGNAARVAAAVSDSAASLDGVTALISR